MYNIRVYIAFIQFFERSFLFFFNSSDPLKRQHDHPFALCNRCTSIKVRPSTRGKLCTRDKVERDAVSNIFIYARERDWTRGCPSLHPQESSRRVFLSPSLIEAPFPSLFPFKISLRIPGTIPSNIVPLPYHPYCIHPHSQWNSRYPCKRIPHLRTAARMNKIHSLSSPIYPLTDHRARTVLFIPLQRNSKGMHFSFERSPLSRKNVNQLRSVRPCPFQI